MPSKGTSLTYEEFMRELVGEPEPEEERGPRRLHEADLWMDDREFGDLLDWLRAHGIHGRFYPVKGDARNAEAGKQGEEGR